MVQWELQEADGVKTAKKEDLQRAAHGLATAFRIYYSQREYEDKRIK